MARCHDVADARAIAFDLVIDEVMEGGGSVARHLHELGRERGRRPHPLESPHTRVHEGRKAVGEPVARWLRWGQWAPSRELAEGVK